MCLYHKCWTMTFTRGAGTVPVENSFASSHNCWTYGLNIGIPGTLAGLGP